MFKLIVEGGALGMVSITVCGLIALILSVMSAAQMFGAQKAAPRMWITGIIFFGSLAPLIGLIWQMTGMMQAFNAIREAGDISPSLIMGGIKLSMYGPLYGLLILLVASLLWFVLKWKRSSMEQ